MKSQKAEQTTKDAIKEQKSNKRGDKCLSNSRLPTVVYMGL